MVKSCKFCGAEMDEKSVKCPECGKLVAGAEIILDKQRQQKKKRNTIIITIIICVVLIIGIAIISIISKKNRTGGNSYINVIDMNLSAMVDDDPTKFLKSYPDFMRDSIEETLGLLAEGGFDEYIELLSDEIIKVYGSDVSVSYNILEKSHMEDDDINEYMQSIFEYTTDYNIEDFPVEEAYKLTIEFTFNGSVGTQTFNTTLATIKTNGSWYLMNIINPINTQVDDQQG